MAPQVVQQPVELRRSVVMMPQPAPMMVRPAPVMVAPRPAPVMVRPAPARVIPGRMRERVTRKVVDVDVPTDNLIQLLVNPVSGNPLKGLDGSDIPPRFDQFRNCPPVRGPDGLLRERIFWL